MEKRDSKAENGEFYCNYVLQHTEEANDILQRNPDVKEKQKVNF